MRTAPTLASASFFMLAASMACAEPVISATPADVVEGEFVHVTATGLRPGQAVTVHASRFWSLYPDGEELYRAQATYSADVRGQVDLRTSRPAPGSSYEHPDPSGLFWSMAPARRLQVSASLRTPPLIPQAELMPGQVRLEAEIDGRIVARADIYLRAAAPGVALREVRDPGVVGVFARNGMRQSQPAIIVLGGSEGGLFTARWAAPLLASQGYAVLGLGYFRGSEPALATLSPNLESIPLETLEAARRWLASQPGVDASRIAVVGVSKGAELALLAGATFPWVSAVGAFAPSHVVWEGIPPDNKSDRSAASSWTYQGRQLPYVRWSKAAERRGDLTRAATGSSRLTEVHLESLSEFASDVAGATIPIERSRAAVFIAVGSDDGMWPSAYSADRLRERLSRRGRRFTSHFEVHPTGHLIMGTGWAPTTQFQRAQGRMQGGNARLDAAAQREIWPAFLQFLRRHLNTPAPKRPN